MRINFAIDIDSNAWKVILDQIGVPFSVIDLLKELNINDYSLLILNNTYNSEELQCINRFINSGGIVIDNSRNLGSISGIKYKQKRVSSLFPGDDIPFPFYDILDINSSILVSKNAQYLSNTLHISNKKNGVICSLGLPIEKCFNNNDHYRKEFPSESKHLPNEEVAAVSKSSIIRLLFELFKYTHYLAKKPFVHKWFFPSSYENVLLFRIDSDEGSIEDVEEWHSISQEANLNFSWFLHTNAHKSWLKKFAEFKGDEIAVHGADHFFSIDKEKQRINILSAIKDINSIDISPQGYAAPFGLWDEDLNSICEELDFQYSSDFSCFYDGLPIYPITSKGISPILQIPIHPICTGTLSNAKMKSNDIENYFKKIVELKKSQLSPLSLYDHPASKHKKLIGKLLQEIKSDTIVNMTFMEYSNWWKERKSIDDVIIDIEDTNILISTKHINPNNKFAAWINNSQYIFVDNNKKTDLSLTELNTVSRKINYTKSDLKRSRGFSLRKLKHDFLINKLYRKKS